MRSSKEEVKSQKRIQDTGISNQAERGATRAKSGG
jgi:hypothetical protein